MLSVKHRLHIYLDIRLATNSVIYNRGGVELEQQPPYCSYKFKLEYEFCQFFQDSEVLSADGKFLMRKNITQASGQQLL